jgi:hypothetical protein
VKNTVSPSTLLVSSASPKPYFAQPTDRNFPFSDLISSFSEPLFPISPYYTNKDFSIEHAAVSGDSDDKDK